MTSGNTLKTVALLAALSALLIFAGRLIGGSGGMIIALVMAFGMNFGAYWFSDKIALAMAGAKEVGPEDAPDLHRVVRQIVQFAGVPMPRVYVVEDPSPNAFATGRDPAHAAIAVTTGILRVLNWEELTGVLAHELAHVKNRDTLVSAIAASIAGAITYLAHMAQWALIFGGLGRNDDGEGEGIGGLVGGFLMIFLAPIAAMIIQLAISRAREYGADATGARIIGNPLALASALEKLHAAVQVRPMHVNPATAHMYIVNPFSGGAIAGLFSTHPPIEERVRRLQTMAMNPSSYSMIR